VYTGVEFAGPFNIRKSKGRGAKRYKGFAAGFILCLVTKAAHLEVLGDFTTDVLLATYKRFTARRGHCVQLYSDNGTNFVGAANKFDND
jgi:hypothetical protein